MAPAISEPCSITAPSPAPVPARRGFSLIGMLITMACMIVLFTIGMSTMNKAVTGGRSAKGGTVHSMQDELQLRALFQSMVAHAADHRGRFLTPSALTGREDHAEDVTANLFSAMLMMQYVSDPRQLISANEFSGYVWPVEGYDYTLYNPTAGVFWDPAFKADLSDLSNVSYAHEPLFGQRFQRHWQTTFDAAFPIIGNRGPRDGIDDPSSLTYGRDGRWGGHAVFGDGHVAFTHSFTPPGAFYQQGGQRSVDNTYAMEDGPGGSDAILSFTSAMTPKGPELQFD